MLAVAIASLAATLRVRLLSIAQHRQAAAINSAPVDAVRSPGVQANTMPPRTISAIPAAMRRSKLSWNTNQARTAVNTASRFSNSAVTEAAVDLSPSMSSTGPTTPPNRMAPASQLASAPRGHAISVVGLRLFAIRRSANTTASPKPEPAYKNPANNTGGISPTSVLAIGVLAPKSAAAANALPMPVPSCKSDALR